MELRELEETVERATRFIVGYYSSGRDVYGALRKDPDRRAGGDALLFECRHGASLGEALRELEGSEYANLVYLAHVLEGSGASAVLEDYPEYVMGEVKSRLAGELKKWEEKLLIALIPTLFAPLLVSLTVLVGGLDPLAASIALISVYVASRLFLIKSGVLCRLGSRDVLHGAGLALSSVAAFELLPPSYGIAASCVALALLAGFSRRDSRAESAMSYYTMVEDLAALTKQGLEAGIGVERVLAAASRAERKSWGEWVGEVREWLFSKRHGSERSETVAEYLDSIASESASAGSRQLESIMLAAREARGVLRELGEMLSVLSFRTRIANLASSASTSIFVALCVALSSRGLSAEVLLASTVLTLYLSSRDLALGSGATRRGLEAVLLFNLVLYAAEIALAGLVLA